MAFARLDSSSAPSPFQWKSNRSVLPLPEMLTRQIPAKPMRHPKSLGSVMDSCRKTRHTRRMENSTPVPPKMELFTAAVCASPM